MPVLEYKYKPRDVFMPFHQRQARFSCIVAHRRAGKTVACVNDLITRALYTKKHRARYSYIAPYYSQAKQIAWDYLKEFAEPFATKVLETNLSVQLLDKATIQLYGADNPDSLRGVYNDGVILDEYGDCRPSLWGQVILPTLADRRGWAAFIGTPKGNNHFREIHDRAGSEPGWFLSVLRASKTGLLPPEELAELRAQMTEEEYLQEFECDFHAAVKGTYYASIINAIEGRGQIGVFPCDWDQSVNVAFDLGYSDSTAAWFWQERPDGVAFIDYYEASGKPLAHYFEMLVDRNYKYGTIWLPHDARAKSLQTGRSTIEQFLAAKFPVKIAPQLSLQAGIDAARLLLPNCWFDKSRCEDGIEALRAYRRDYDEKLQTFRDGPLHDWSSHGSDAFRYAALVARAGKNANLARRQAMSIPAIASKELNLESLFTDRERRLRFQSRRI